MENFYVKKESAESASPDSICLDVNSSVIFNSGCFAVKVLALFQDHGILRPGLSQKYPEFHYLLGECIHFWDSVESVSV